MIPLPNHEFFEGLLKPRGVRPNQDWEERNKTFDPYVAVCFSASWCGPCRRLDKASLVKLSPNVKWYSCDVDEVQETLGYCGLQSIPSFVLIKDGQFVDRKSGAGSVGELLEWLAQYSFPVAAY